MLVPLWKARYGYAGKTYHYMINGENGKVSAQYPKSVGKIILVILLALAVFFGGLMLLESGSSDYGGSHYDYSYSGGSGYDYGYDYDYGGYDYSYDSGSSWDSGGYDYSYDSGDIDYGSYDYGYDWGGDW